MESGTSLLYAMYNACCMMPVLASLILASERWCEEQFTPSVRSPMIDEERMRPGDWLELLLCVPLSTYFDIDS